MSDYKTHMIVGIITSLIVALVLYFTTNLIQLNIPTILMFIIIAYIYSLLPDIDIKSGTIVWNFLGVGILGILCSIANNKFHFIDNGTTVMIASCALLVITFVCAEFCSHRGIIHTIRMGLVFASLSWFIHHNLGLCLIAFIVYYSHLVCDNMWSSL